MLTNICTHTRTTYAREQKYSRTTRLVRSSYAGDVLYRFVKKKNNYNNNKKIFIVPCVLSIECRRVTRTLQAPK